MSGEQYVVDEGETDHTSSPMVSGAVGDSARDGVLSSETPVGGVLPQHQQDVIAQDPSHTGGLAAAAQEAGAPYNGVDVGEGANCSAEGGLIEVLSPETPDDETEHHPQEAIANDPSHTDGLETAQQEAGLSLSEADAEGANGAAEGGSVAGALVSSETSDEGTQHHQQGVVAHDASRAGDLEAAQEAGKSDKGDLVEGASGPATAQQADMPDKGDVESANGSSAAAQEASTLADNGSVEGADASAESGLEAPRGMVAKSSAGALPREDGVRENVAEHRQQEDSDELYDIDDLEMSSSEDH